MTKQLSKIDAHSLVAKTEFFISEPLVVCVLTLKDGFKVTGEACPLDPDSFDQQLGEELSLEKAIAKIYHLEAYYLKRLDNNLK